MTVRKYAAPDFSCLLAGTRLAPAHPFHRLHLTRPSGSAGCLHQIHDPRSALRLPLTGYLFFLMPFEGSLFLRQRLPEWSSVRNIHLWRFPVSVSPSTGPVSYTHLT